MLIILIGTVLAITKYDWINNYFALQCTCPSQCCIYGSFIVQNDTVMNNNFVQINAKLQGSNCTNYTVSNVICYFTNSTSVSTTLTCPSMNWAWSVSKDNSTGSVYWTDGQSCQGVWNIIDMNAGSVQKLMGFILVNLILYII